MVYEPGYNMMSKLEKIFISDLHLGDGSGSDDFHQTEPILQLLDLIEKEAEELIILGDLFELWQADLDKVLFIHNDILKKLFSLRKRLRLTYVVGNHDYIPFARFVEFDIGIKLEYRDESQGIVAEHGNRYDIFNRFSDPRLAIIKQPAGRYFSGMVGRLERIIHPDFDRWLKKGIEQMDGFLQQAIEVKNKIPPSSKEYLDRGGHYGEFEEAVKNHIRNGAKLVVFGHTHKAQLNRIEDGIYANCGAWTGEIEPTYVASYVDRVELRDGINHKSLKKLELVEEQFK